MVREKKIHILKKSFQTQNLKLGHIMHYFNFGFDSTLIGHFGKHFHVLKYLLFY